MKSALAAGWPPTRTSGPGRVRGVANGLERGLALVGAAVGDRDRLDERGAVAAPVGALGGDGAVDAVDLAQVGRHPFGVGVALDQDLVRQQRALADAGVLERDEAVLGVARLRDRVGVGGAELQVGRGEREREHDRHAGAGREPAAPRHRLGPARPRAARLVVGAPVGPVERDARAWPARPAAA